MKFNGSNPNVKVKITGIIDTATPKMKDESISPSMIAQNVIGQQISLSRVLERVSHGTIPGPTEVEAVSYTHLTLPTKA